MFGGVIKNISVSTICVTFILDVCKVSLLNYWKYFLILKKKVTDVKDV